MDLPTPLRTRFSVVILGELHRTTARMTVSRKEQLLQYELEEHLSGTQRVHRDRVVVHRRRPAALRIRMLPFSDLSWQETMEPSTDLTPETMKSLNHTFASLLALPPAKSASLPTGSGRRRTRRRSHKSKRL